MICSIWRPELDLAASSMKNTHHCRSKALNSRHALAHHQGVDGSLVLDNPIGAVLYILEAEGVTSAELVWTTAPGIQLGHDRLGSARLVPSDCNYSETSLGQTPSTGSSDTTCSAYHHGSSSLDLGHLLVLGGNGFEGAGHHDVMGC